MISPLSSLRAGLALLSLGLTAACSLRHAQYAGWEPMPAGIPAVSDAAKAKLHVAQSRALWQAFRAGKRDLGKTGFTRARDVPGYTYVRAQQRSKELVDFTLFVVERERVVVRALIEARLADLDPYPRQDFARWPDSLWVERGNAVGSHSDGAASRTIDQLYDECERMIDEHPSQRVRLYFHPNGILMHCGFSREDCRECGAVAIQSFSSYRLDDETPRDDPAKWVCPSAWGVFAPGSEVPELADDLACYAPPYKSSPAPQPVPVPDGYEVAEVSSGLPPICDVDPAACPYDSAERRRARWTLWRPNMCPLLPGRAPTALEVGKPEPLGVWTFPFIIADGLECGRELHQPFRIRIQPTLPAPAPR